VLAGGFLFVLLVLYDLTAAHENPYRSLVTFIGAPSVVGLGLALFVVSASIQIREARRRGENVRFRLSIDPTDPRYLKNLWLFLGLSAAAILAVAYSGTRAYEATDSVAFCGQTCHTVMAPQMMTYDDSPHARVACVECHIGPGATFWVKSKLDGLRQVYATILDTYSRPIPTPISDLRPAQATCEGCHWPKAFYGMKLVTHTYYRTDETNSPWTIEMALKIGGGNPRTGALEGIHWHMLTPHVIDYVAADEQLQQLPWVRVTEPDGTVTVYTNSTIEGFEQLDPAADSPPPGHEVRRFDCIDCHNRPTHLFRPPAVALDLALGTRRISPRLPFIKKTALELLTAEYPDRKSAHQAISRGIESYYEKHHPDPSRSMSREIEAAVEAVTRIYDENFFPDMKTDYRSRTDNLGHWVNDGCFRCHTSSMTDKNGDSLAHACDTCHDIVAQGGSESVAQLEENVNGLAFQHPEDIAGMWREVKCTECHTPDSGY
jgi:hypothetical protein